MLSILRGRGPWFGALLTLALVTACGGPEVRLLQRDESVTFDRLRAGRMAVIGVASLVGHDEDPEYDVVRWPTILRNKVLVAREEFDLVPPVLVAEQLGEEAHARLMKSYRRHGVLDSVQLAEIDDLIEGEARYGVLARIEDIALERDRTETDEDPDPKDEKIKVTKKTSRIARASFDVYDLAERRSVWSGEITSAVTHDESWNEEQEKGKKKRSWFRGLVEGLFSSGEPDYPEPPAVVEAVEAVCFDFGRSLPKQDD